MSRGPSTRTRQRRTPGEATAVGEAVAATDAAPPTDVVRDGFVLDFISDAKQVKETPKELVRQRIARALFHEYGISVEDMAADFPVSVGGRRRRVDIAIFGAGEAHEPDNVQRVVVCRPEPKQNRRGAVKMRDYEQAAQDIAEVKPFFEEIEACRYALWTNGLEFFFLHRKATKFQVDAEPIGDWPPVDESIDDRNVLSRARARRADPEMLRTAFRRCHNFIHGNEGMPKDAAFWQFLYLIFCKMYDERSRRDRRRFWAGPQEQFTDDGRRTIRKRIEPLFGEVKREFKSIFSGNEEISLSDRALAFMISELSKYEFARIDVDAKGAAYQEIVGTNLRGDRGQYFTPRGAIRLVVEILGPREDERLLDPACGTGGFLVAALAHRMIFDDDTVERIRTGGKVLMHPLIPQASDHAEDFSIRPLFHEHASERLHQRANPILGPIGEMVVQHQPLPKQRMRPPLHRVRLQPAVITDALARCTQQRQHGNRQRADQQEAVPPVRARHMHRRQPHSEAHVLDVPKARLNSPALAVVPNQDPRRDRRIAGHQAPRFVHLRVVYAHDHADRQLVRVGHPSTHQPPRTPPGADPRGGRAPLAPRTRHVDVSTQPNHVFEGQLRRQRVEQLAVPKAPVRQDGDFHPGRQHLPQPAQQTIVRISAVLARSRSSCPPGTPGTPARRPPPARSNSCPPRFPCFARSVGIRRSGTEC